MPDFSADDLFDTFILGALADGPRSLTGVRERAERAERLLYLAAARSGKKALGSMADSVDRLTRDGYLKREVGSDPSRSSDRYLLTTSGSSSLNAVELEEIFSFHTLLRTPTWTNLFKHS